MEHRERSYRRTNYVGPAITLVTLRVDVLRCTEYTAGTALCRELVRCCMRLVDVLIGWTLLLACIEVGALLLWC